MLYNRIVYQREAKKIFGALNTAEMSCGEISGKFGTRFGFKSFEAFHYPEHDICLDAPRDEKGKVRKFDMMIADQVWEHLDRPYAATKHVHEMLNPGGYFYVCVPFYVRYHKYPVDCSRWSARGLKNLLIECGFPEENIQSDQWGNLTCARKECGPRFARWREGDSLDNDENFPIVAWALGRKALKKAAKSKAGAAAKAEG
jgi:SAM-dependent methyltransferase